MESTTHPDGASVHAGFPNAADDSRLKALSLDKLLVKNPNSTFYFRVAGNAWQAIGVFDDDIAIVDRALTPQGNDLVVWWLDSEFAISTYTHLPKDACTWGVITATIHMYKKAAT